MAAEGGRDHVNLEFSFGRDTIVLRRLLRERAVAAGRAYTAAQRAAAAAERNGTRPPQAGRPINRIWIWGERSLAGRRRRHCDRDVIVTRYGYVARDVPRGVSRGFEGALGSPLAGDQSGGPGGGVTCFTSGARRARRHTHTHTHTPGSRGGLPRIDAFRRGAPALRPAGARPGAETDR